MNGAEAARPPHRTPAESVPDAAPGDVADTIDEVRGLVEERLTLLTPDLAALPQPLGASIRYSLLAPGKRLRPLATVLTAMQCGAGMRRALDVACATEMIHVASLVIDDLPCMDDAALRRGQPANHRAFGEGPAILAAIGLLALAFRTAAQADGIGGEERAAILARLSGAVGPSGLVAGQALDLRATAAADLAEIRQKDFRKTAELFCACCEAGVLAAGGSARDRLEACAYAENVGLAFQMLDDLKDARLSPEATGKDVGKDVGKQTLLAALGSDAVARQVRRHLRDARRAADRIGSSPRLLLGFIDHCIPETVVAELAE